MINDKAKVILIGFTSIALLSGCGGIMKSFDGSNDTQMQSFKSGTPTYYEDQQEAMMGRLMEDRERELLASRILWKPMDYENNPDMVDRTGTTNISYKPTGALATITTEEEALAALELTEPLVVAAIDDLDNIKPKEVEMTPARAAMMKLMQGGTITPEPDTEEPVYEEPEVPAEPVSIAVERTTPARKGEPKIKVVSGDGMPLSAIQLKKELDDAGYNVDRIDVAPFEFKQRVVFYAPGFEGNAREIADEIAAGGGTKPLTWKSVYDIIVVSVNPG